MTKKTTSPSVFIAYLLISSSVLIIPFIFTNHTIDPTSSLRFTFLSISLLMVILVFSYSILRKTKTWDVSILGRFIFPILILYLGISALSLFKAINLQEGIFDLFKIFVSVVFIIISSIILVNIPNGVSLLSKTVIITGGISAAIGMCQYYHLAFNSIPGNFVIYGTMTNKNLFASFLFLTLPFSLYGFFELKNPWNFLGVIASVLTLWCIFLAASRAVWFSLLVSICSVGIISWFILRKLKIDRKEKIRYLTKVSVLVVTVFCLCTVSYFSGSNITDEPLKGKVVSATNLSGSTNQLRYQLWNKTFSMIADYPLLGVGLGNWKINIPKYGTKGLPSQDGRIQYIRPHNDFLWVWAETGLLGFLSYLLIFIISIYYLFKLLRQIENLKDKFFVLMMLFGIIGFIVISVFSFPKERIAHLIFFNVLVVVTIVMYHQKFGLKRKRGTIPIFPILIFSLIILGFSLVIGYQKFRFEMHMKKAYNYWEANQWNKMLTETEKAQNSFFNMDPNASPVYWIQGIANMYLGEKEDALKDFQKATAFHPFLMQLLNNLATCYGLLNDNSNAVKYYKKVLEISPQYENSLRNLSVIYYNMGNYEDALKTYSQVDFNSDNETFFKYLEIYGDRLKVNN